MIFKCETQPQITENHIMKHEFKKYDEKNKKEIETLKTVQSDILLTADVLSAWTRERCL